VLPAVHVMSCWASVVTSAVQEGLTAEPVQGSPEGAGAAAAATDPNAESAADAHMEEAAAIAREGRDRLRAAAARGVRLLRGSPSVAELVAEVEAWLVEGGRVQARLEGALESAASAIACAAQLSFPLAPTCHSPASVACLPSHGRLSTLPPLDSLPPLPPAGRAARAQTAREQRRVRAGERLSSTSLKAREVRGTLRGGSSTRRESWTR